MSNVKGKIEANKKEAKDMSYVKGKIEANKKLDN